MEVRDLCKQNRLGVGVKYVWGWLEVSGWSKVFLFHALETTSHVHHSSKASCLRRRLYNLGGQTHPHCRGFNSSHTMAPHSQYSRCTIYVNLLIILGSFKHMYCHKPLLRSCQALDWAFQSFPRSKVAPMVP